MISQKLEKGKGLRNQVQLGRAGKGSEGGRGGLHKKHGPGSTCLTTGRQIGWRRWQKLKETEKKVDTGEAE